MIYHQRSEWENPAQPVSGPAPRDTTTQAVCHYTAMPSIPTSAVVLLRSIQNDYLTDPKRGYSIGYWAYVDQQGEAWQLRGPHPLDPKKFNAAANPGKKKNAEDGTSVNHNNYTAPILFGIRPDEAISAAAIDTAVKLWRSWGVYGRPWPHRQIDYTGCCGDPAVAQIAAGLLDISASVPVPPPEPPKEADMPKTAKQTRVDSRTAAYHKTLKAGEAREVWLDLPGGAQFAQVNVTIIPAKTDKNGFASIGSNKPTEASPNNTINWSVGDTRAQSTSIVWTPDSKTVWIESNRDCEFVIDFTGIYW